MLDYTSRGDLECRITIYFTDPNRRADLDALKHADDYAADMLGRLNQAIKDLQQYRADMAARAAYLVTAEPTISASLTRRRDRYANKVFYDFVEVSTYPDGTSREISKTTYTGTDRAKALAFVKQYQRDTGRKVNINIQRPSWEH